MEEKILIEAKNLKKYFKVGANSQLHAVDGVNFKIRRGTTLGVVGESGCGKSTLGRLLLRLYDVTDGQIIYDGTDITKLNAKELKPIRARMQMIFQDPSGSLDPRKSVKELIGEPLKIYKACKNRDEYDARIAEIMETVGLDERYAESFSHELDGGRRQRIGIGRALAMDPEFIICDEPRDHGHVSGPVCGICQDRGSVQESAPPLYQGSAGCCAHPQPEGQKAFHRGHARRTDQPCGPGSRLPFCGPLSLCNRCLPRQGYPLEGSGTRPLC